MNQRQIIDSEQQVGPQIIPVESISLPPHTQDLGIKTPEGVVHAVVAMDEGAILLTINGETIIVPPHSPEQLRRPVVLSIPLNSGTQFNANISWMPANRLLTIVPVSSQPLAA